MPTDDENNATPRPTEAQFCTTHWSRLLDVRQADPVLRQEAVEDLCRLCWPPVYAFIRRKGYTPSDAQDLTQEIFVRLLERNVFAVADSAKGKLRSFLLTVVQRSLVSEWRKLHTQKRGKHFTFISADDPAADKLPMDEQVCGLDPAQRFERDWAMRLLDEVGRRLREWCVANGNGALFDALAAAVLGGGESPSYAEVGKRFDKSEAAIKKFVERARERYCTLVREVVAETVSSSAEVDLEIRHLLSVVRT